MGRPRLPGVKAIGIRLRAVDIAQAKRVAATSCIPYQSVIRMWVAEKAEASKNTTPK